MRLVETKCVVLLEKRNVRPFMMRFFARSSLCSGEKSHFDRETRYPLRYLHAKTATLAVNIVGVMGHVGISAPATGARMAPLDLAFFFHSEMLRSCRLYTLIGSGTNQNAKALDDGKQTVKRK
jgi:hypothetical protein